MIRTVLVCILVVACNKHGDDDTLLDDYLAMWADTARAVEASQGDCTKMVAGLDAVALKYDHDLPRIRAYADNVLPKKLEDPAFANKIADRIKRTGLTGHYLEKCIDDPRLKDVAKKLGAS